MRRVVRTVMAVSALVGMLVLGVLPHAAAETSAAQDAPAREVSFSADGINFFPNVRYRFRGNPPGDQMAPGQEPAYVTTDMRLETRNPQEVRMFVRIRDVADLENDHLTHYNPIEHMVRTELSNLQREGFQCFLFIQGVTSKDETGRQERHRKSM